MTLPEGVRREVEQALAELDLGRRIDRTVPIGGGCISNGARIETDSGASLFLKWNKSSPADMFEAEADGLRALSETAPQLRIPRPRAWGDDSSGTAWLLIDFVVAGPSSPEAERVLGRGLADMHAHAGTGGFGWERDNWIGSLEQRNTVSEHWGEFWRDYRIQPQLTLARRNGRVRDAAFDALLDVIPGLLADVTRPELVHGDLWSGNWFADERGRPVLIDPAVYRGHGEVDLAMSELFGGFGPGFYEAYDDAVGIPSAYTAYRKDLYQLYYLLVHVNLFGGSYEAGSLRAARRVLSEVG